MKDLDSFCASPLPSSLFWYLIVCWLWQLQASQIHTSTFNTRNKGEFPCLHIFLRMKKMFQGVPQETFFSYIINYNCVTYPPESYHLASNNDVMVTDISRHSNTGDGDGPSLSARTWGLEERENNQDSVIRKEVGQWLLGRESMGSSSQMHYVIRPWLGCQGNLLDWELSSSFTDEVTEVKLPRSTVYKVKELEFKQRDSLTSKNKFLTTWYLTNLVKENCSSLKCVFFPQIHSCVSFVVAVHSLSWVPLFVTPWTVAHRLPCPSPSPGACSNSLPLSQWCLFLLQMSCPLSSPSPPALNFPVSGFFFF